MRVVNFDKKPTLEQAQALPTPIETLRHMVEYFDHQRETFNDRFTLDQLAKIYAFSMSTQGDHVHEMADSWPPYLLNAVLRAKLGAKLPEALVKRAGDEC